MQILKEDEGVKVSLDYGIVLKEVYGFNHSGLRNKLTPQEMVSREIRALEKLNDIDGIQKIKSTHLPNAFTSIYIEGTSLREYQGLLPNSYFSQLDEIIKQCEQRGVYRIGINRSDFIVRNNHSPAIVDFGNILFSDDTIALLPGIISLVKAYSRLRMKDIKSRYAYADEANKFIIEQ